MNEFTTCSLSNLKEITLKGDLQKAHFKIRLNKRKQKLYFHQKLFYKWATTFKPMGPHFFSFVEKETKYCQFFFICQSCILL